MSPQYESDNAYVSELKSLLKDKFFMMLLGISVAIVILSTFYSFIRPKAPPQGEVTDVAAAISPTIEAQSTAKTLTMDETAQVQEVTIAPTVTVVEPIESGTPEEKVLAADLGSIDEQQLDDEIKGLSVDEQAAEQKDERSFMTKIKDMLGLGGGSIESSDEASVTPGAQDESSTGDVAGTTAPVVKPGSEYVVADGDSLWSIASKVYGSGYNFVDIIEANQIDNPDVLYVGTKLKIPQVAVRQPSGEITDTAAMTKNPDTIPATYTVQQGDNLWSIASKMYNNGYEWTKIASYNSLAQPDFINPGQILRLK